jgi:hypothetical protein
MEIFTAVVWINRLALTVETRQVCMGFVVVRTALGQVFVFPSNSVFLFL